MNQMNRRSFCALLLALSIGASLQAGEATAPSASDILRSMDKNLQYDSRTAGLKMTVNNGRRVLVYQMQTFARGKSDSAIEYLSPERDKGTRMLKLGDNMWIYMPSAEKVQKIAGHMLRQGMMGSDISYEDMMASADFEKSYKATVVGEEPLDGRVHYKIEALAVNNTVAYPKRLIWVDKEWLIPTRQELFALSGMKLKTWTMGDVKRMDSLNVPMKMEIIDHLKQGSRTTVEIQDMKLHVALKDEIFSLRWLERR